MDIDEEQICSWPLKARGDSQRNSYSFINEYLSPEDCDMFIANIEKYHTLARATTRDVDKSKEMRESQIAWVSMKDPHSQVYKKMTDAVVSANNEFWRFNLSAIESIQYTVYDSVISKKSRYDWHQDEGFSQTWDNSIRKLSFVCLLTDPDTFTGGELQIMVDTENTVLPLKQGSIVFFPSPTLHRVTPVTSGVRKTLVGWVRGPCWK